jgi:hypothetical protein
VDDCPRDPLLDAVIAALQDEVDLGPAVDARVLAALRSRPAVPWHRRLWHGLRTPRIIRVSPLAALGSAALVTAAVLVAGRLGRTPEPAVDATGGLQHVEFVLVAPGSHQVSLAGDFNNWNDDAAPLTREADGRWRITIPLKPGRYRYTFRVDGKHWVGDPTQPPAVDDDFGTPTSVITVAQR